jgi:hypothetical protein
LGSLDAFADGTLPDVQRAAVAAHLQTCNQCQESLRQTHRLDYVLTDLPAIPAVPFSKFWSGLEPRLPGHAGKRTPWFRPARLAGGFALAVLASLVGVVALASDEVMPDSPLYAVKHFRQGVQVNLADAHDRPRLQLFLAKQRLKEASVMLERRRDDLAVASLRDVKTLMTDAKPRLERAPGGKPNPSEVSSTLAQIKTDLNTVSAANQEPDGSTAAEMAAVDHAIQEAEKAVPQVETPSSDAPSEPAPTE